MVQIVRVEGIESLRRKYEQMGNDIFPTALARAVNRVSNTIKSRSAKDLSEATGLKQSSIRRRIKFIRKATKADPTAVLEMSGKPFNLVEFVSGAKERKSPRGGVTANAWGKRRKYPGVFLAQMPNGQVIAVQRSRAGRGSRRSGIKTIMRGRWAGKSPHIEPVYGAGIAREASSPVVAAQRQKTMSERLPIELAHEIDFAIKRIAAKRGRALARWRA